MKFNLRFLLAKAPGLLLLAATVEILLRRWVWHQIPSQVSAPVVYALLLGNLSLVYFSLRTLFGAERVAWTRRGNRFPIAPDGVSPIILRDEVTT